MGMKKYYAFGREVPKHVIDGFIEDGMAPEEITTEFLETALFWDYLDEEL